MSLFVLVSVNLILKPLFFLAFEIVGWMFQSSQPFFKTCLLKVILVVHTSTVLLPCHCVSMSTSNPCVYTYVGIYTFICIGIYSI